MRSRPPSYARVLGFPLALMACSEQAPPERPPTPVRVQRVEFLDAGASLRYSASVEPHSQVDAAFKVGGYVREIPQRPDPQGRPRDLQAGDRVEAGELLARLDEREFRDQLVAAEAQLRSAHAHLQKAAADFRRASKLYATQSLTAPEYDQARQEHEVAQADVQAARAQVDAAELQLSYCSLHAPLSGLVLERAIEIGGLARVGQVAFRLADTHSVKVVFGVPDGVLPDLRMGALLALRTASLPERVFEGPVTALAPKADARTRVFEIEISVPNPDGALRLGMIASLLVERGAEDSPVLSVPLDAVVRPPGAAEGYAVFTVEAQGQVSVARLRPVELSDVSGSRAIVRAGLPSGESVVVMGASLLQDGSRVRVIP